MQMSAHYKDVYVYTKQLKENKNTYTRPACILTLSLANARTLTHSWGNNIVFMLLTEEICADASI
jgi:hypothetical protein